MLTVGIVGYGTFFGDLGAAFAAAIHVGSAFDSCLRHIPGALPGRRIFFALAVTMTILLGLYGPIVAIVRWIAFPFVMQQDAGSLASGDVLLANELFHPADFPRVGQVVVYNEDRQVQFRHIAYEIAGPRIDRIVAIGGDHVVWDKPNLFVNGEPSSALPLNPDGLPDHMDVTVPIDRVLLWPSVGATPQMRVQWIFWADFALVPRSDLLEAVYWRWGPFWRMGPVR
jgi:hypothetical protein